MLEEMISTLQLTKQEEEKVTFIYFVNGNHVTIASDDYCEPISVFCTFT